MCNAPSDLRLKRNDLSFVPVQGVFVFEFLLEKDGVSVKVPVSTPDSFKGGRFHYLLNSSNYGQLGASSGTKISVRSFCIESYWFTDQVETNYSHYKNDETKFSGYSNSVTFK